MSTEETFLALDCDDVRTLRSISAALNNPTLKVDWDKRRDLANLLDLVLSRAVRFTEDELK